MLQLYAWFHDASCNACKLISKSRYQFQIYNLHKNLVYRFPIRSDKDFSS